MESGQPSSVPKVERKVVEKKRRNLMKGLYSQLQSLLPNHDTNSKEKLQLPDQIDEAVKYIKSLQMKLEKSNEKKEYLQKRRSKRPFSCTESDNNNNNNILPETKTNLPVIEIHEMDPSMFVVLVKGLDSIFRFYDIVSLLHEEGVKIVNVTFSIHEHSTFQIVREEKIEKSTSGFEAKRLSRRLNELFSGASSSSDTEPLLQLWDDFEIEPSFWGSEIAEVIPLLGVQSFLI